MTRARAAFEVLACSGFPTQLLIVTTLAAFGIAPLVNGQLSPRFVFAVSAADTVLLLALVFLFVRASGERPRDVFLGPARPLEEIIYGLLTLPLVFLIVLAVQVLIRLVAPALHNVEVSPFTSLLGSPMLLAGFVALVLVAGGLREELQRAFLLHRFEQALGGPWVGLAITSVAFGLGHTVQGWDAAVVTALLGAFWGAVYLRRRSVVGTVMSHALFNLAQVLLGYVLFTPA